MGLDVTLTKIEMHMRDGYSRDNITDLSDIFPDILCIATFAQDVEIIIPARAQNLRKLVICLYDRYTGEEFPDIESLSLKPCIFTEVAQNAD